MPIVRDGRNRLEVYSLGPIGASADVTTHVRRAPLHHDAGLSRAARVRRPLGPGERRRSMLRIAERDARAQRVLAALAEYDAEDPLRVVLVADDLRMKPNAVAIVAKHAAIRKAGASA